MRACDSLLSARENGVTLSPRSLDLIAAESVDARNAFLSELKDIPVTAQATLITCMEMLKKDSENADALSMLVVGTESGHVHFLPPDASDSATVCSIKIPSAPVLLSVSGLFDIEWRVVAACRDGKLYSIKNGEVRGTAVLTGIAIDSGSLAIAIARQDKQVVVSTMDKQLSSYSIRGKRVSGLTRVIASCCRFHVDP